MSMKKNLHVHTIIRIRVAVYSILGASTRHFSAEHDTEAAAPKELVASADCDSSRCWRTRHDAAILRGTDVLPREAETCCR
jgi:hypothetical protein